MSDPHTEALVATRQRYLEALELQQAQYGLLTPPHIILDIVQTQAEIAQLRRQRVQQVLQPQTLLSAPPPIARGLILLVSPRRPAERLEDLATYQALVYHQRNLQQCWLIATSGANGSLSTAHELAQRFQSYGVPCSIWQVIDAAHVNETFTLVDWIYTSDLRVVGLEEHEVVADITGATKPMTAGMVLACGSQRPMQYMVFQDQGPSLPMLLRVAKA